MSFCSSHCLCSRRQRRQRRPQRWSTKGKWWEVLITAWTFNSKWSSFSGCENIRKALWKCLSLWKHTCFFAPGSTGGAKGTWKIREGEGYGAPGFLQDSQKLLTSVTLVPLKFVALRSIKCLGCQVFRRLTKEYVPVSEVLAEWTGHPAPPPKKLGSDQLVVFCQHRKDIVDFYGLVSPTQLWSSTFPNMVHITLNLSWVLKDDILYTDCIQKREFSIDSIWKGYFSRSHSFYFFKIHFTDVFLFYHKIPHYPSPSTRWEHPLETRGVHTDRLWSPGFIAVTSLRHARRRWEN